MEQKKLLYIGNHLTQPHNNPTTITVLGDLLEDEGFAVRYASSEQNKLWRLLDMLWKVWQYQKTTDTVLIDTYSTWNFYYAVSAGWLCQMLKQPYICILHGGNLENRLKSSSALSKQLFNNAKHIVAPSLYLKTVFEGYGYQVDYIPNSIKIENYPFISKAVNTVKLLWVRAFAQIYNPEMAVRVLHSLKEKGLEATLCMVGPDKDGSLYKVKQLAKQLKVDVIFTGKLSKSEWVKLSKDYNIFINTTNFDNMPVSVIEAMALGLPVVSTNVGGIPFLIEHKKNGLLSPQNDVEAMVGNILKLKNNRDGVESMAKSARQSAENFNWSSVKQSWNILLAYE